jgi:transposase InsO family protein
MKDSNPDISLDRFCRLLGVSRQAHYQNKRFKDKVSESQMVVLDEIEAIRVDHPSMGTRKLYDKLQEFLSDHRIKMGRDALFDLLASQQLLVRRRKQRVFTTQSYHWLKKYPDIVDQINLVRPNQLWVSDITYYRTNSGFIYISFITDAYSHKIVGFAVADNLEASNSVRALQMAIDSLGPDPARFGLTHHSDRGIQYCCKEYVKMLDESGIRISMTEDGNPLKNAIAERVNGIIKQEYMAHYTIKNANDAAKCLVRIIKLYNEQRPHWSCNMNTPEEVHNKNAQPKRLWKTYYRKKESASSFQVIGEMM